MSDPDSDSPAAPSDSAQKAISLLGSRPPLPPAPQEAGWTWTEQKLKAVYLEAFTDIQKKQIAEMVGVSTQTFFNWRSQGDYKRYMAELVYSDGLGEKVQRNITRKKVADALLLVILDKLSKPGALAGEKVSALVKSFNDLLLSIGEDAAGWEKVTAQAQAGTPVSTDGSQMAAYIRAIDNPEERETVRRHLLEIFKSHMDGGPRAPAREHTEILDAETVPADPVGALDSATAGPAPEDSGGDLDPSALE